MAYTRILHIEDDHVDAKVMQKWLTSSPRSFDLERVESLAAAFERSAEKSFDVVLLDLSLPDGRGQEALAKARQHFAEHPIIVVTGNIDQEQAESFVDLGADDYLFKSELNESCLWKSIVYSIRKKQLELELHAHTQELKIATELERRANASKTQFLANVSHDLRTPLGVILGYSEILETTAEIPGEALSYVRRIKNNVQTLVELVNDLLDLSKVESGHLDVRPQDTLILGELSEIFSNHAFKAAQKKIGFEINFSSPLPKRVKIDRVRLRQVLDNILANAIKFTDQGSVKISVGTRITSELTIFTFEVEDTGPGIPEDVRERIFEPFQQGNPDVSRRFGGAGLGLALSRRLAQALSGSVELVSSVVSVGSMFRFTIPVEHSVGVEIIDNPAKHLKQMNTERVLDEQTKQRWQDRRVLLAEDNPDNQYLMEYMLKRFGFDVDTVANGADAVTRAMGGEYDMVLMDMQMPIMTGYEAVNKLRDSGYSKPIVALTAFAMESERERCLKSGCDGYLSKPVTRKRLAEKIGEFCAENGRQ